MSGHRKIETLSDDELLELLLELDSLRDRAEAALLARQGAKSTA